MDYTSLQLYTPPTAEPVSRAQAKTYLRIDGTDEDDLVDDLIAAARAWVEHETGRALVAQVWKLRFASFPSVIELPMPPLLSVGSIAYNDSNGDAQTLATTEYSVYGHNQPAVIREAYQKTWPTTRGEPEDVTVTFTCGHGVPFTSTVASDLITPSPLVHADADIVRLATTDSDLPASLAGLTDYHIRDTTSTTHKLAATAGGAAVTLTDDGTGTHFLSGPYNREPMPPMAVRAVLWLTAHLYEHREAVSDGVDLRELPLGIQSAVWQLKSEVQH